MTLGALARTKIILIISGVHPQLTSPPGSVAADLSLPLPLSGGVTLSLSQWTYVVRILHPALSHFTVVVGLSTSQHGLD